MLRSSELGHKLQTLCVCVCVCYINLSHPVTTNRLFGITSVAFCLHFPSFLTMEILIERRRGEELNGSCLPQFGGRLLQEPRINKQNIFALFDGFLFPPNYSTSFADMSVLGKSLVASFTAILMCVRTAWILFLKDSLSRVVSTPDLRPVVISENAHSVIITSSWQSVLEIFTS